MEFAKYFDHTLLRADATKEEIVSLCEEAKCYSFATVCVNPYWLETAARILRESDVGLCTVIGFPLGADSTETKAFAAADALKKGAQEVDMVINIGEVKSHRWEAVTADIARVKAACGEKVLKVILETCLLTEEEIEKSCLCALEAKADFVKTSTGFSKGGADKEAVRLMRETVKERMGVKASGGIRTYEDAAAMIAAGASRIGASASVMILKKYRENGNRREI